MITYSDSIIKKDNSIVVLPKDGTGSGTSMIVGLDDTENIRLAKVTPDGKLMVDAALSVTGVSIGDVVIKSPDLGGSVSPLNRTTNDDGTSALYVQDKRLSFSSNKLNVNAYGSNGIISNDASGNVNVNVLSAPTLQIYGKDNIYPETSLLTSNGYSQVASYNVRNYVNKSIFIKNTGTESAMISIFGSLDGGVSYDVPLTTDVQVLPGNSMLFDDSRAFSNLRVMAKSEVTGLSTTITSKAYVMGA